MAKGLGVLDNALIKAQCASIAKRVKTTTATDVGRYAKMARIGLTVFACMSMLLTCVFADGVDSISSAISSGMGQLYSVIKIIAIPVGAVALGFSAFQIFTGGEKGMEKAKKTILYTAIGIGIALLAPLLISTVSGWFSDVGDQGVFDTN